MNISHHCQHPGSLHHHYHHDSHHTTTATSSTTPIPVREFLKGRRYSVKSAFQRAHPLPPKSTYTKIKERKKMDQDMFVKWKVGECKVSPISQSGEREVSPISQSGREWNRVEQSSRQRGCRGTLYGSFLSRLQYGLRTNLPLPPSLPPLSYPRLMIFKSTKKKYQLSSILFTHDFIFVWEI